MQKLAKRAAQAQRQATRRAIKQIGHDDAGKRSQARQGLKSAVKEVRENLEAARRARREDWELGPLAPKRDLGFNNYGAAQEGARQDWTHGNSNRERPQRIEQRCAWAGGVGQLNLAPQDRVVILDGPDKGKIDRIQRVQLASGTVTLENYHRALTVGVFDDPSRSQAMPISISSIRLVYPLPDPKTGVVRDVIINQLKAVSPNMHSPNMSLDRWQHGKKWDRVVPGLNTVIPWPEVEVPEYEAKKADTVREQVEERTFYYSLLGPPMPDQVLDELRNKYSRFRTRHEKWYVEQKEAEAEAKRRRTQLQAASMQTPLDEFHEKQRQLRAAEPEPVLSEDLLEKIGEFMANKQGAALHQDDVSNAASQPSAPQS